VHKSLEVKQYLVKAKTPRGGEGGCWGEECGTVLGAGGVGGCCVFGVWGRGEGYVY